VKRGLPVRPCLRGGHSLRGVDDHQGAAPGGDALRPIEPRWVPRKALSSEGCGATSERSARAAPAQSSARGDSQLRTSPGPRVEACRSARPVARGPPAPNASGQDAAECAWSRCHLAALPPGRGLHYDPHPSASCAGRVAVDHRAEQLWRGDPSFHSQRSEPSPHRIAHAINPRHKLCHVTIVTLCYK
jgi:hypothetical protein